MCGIAGFLHADRERPADEARLRRMTDALAHRGPDGAGYVVRGALGLGHRRLSIIDLATGDQPMTNDDGSVVLSFNGEIYNYVELREELRALGRVFRTDSDTEVIIRAYEQWGDACQRRFNGMWAFALWDSGSERLLLSRDRLGEKPLHYALHDRTLVFASEIKSLFAYGVPRRPDLAWSEVYACLGFVPAPHSFYAGVMKLPPAHCLVWQDGRTTLTRYWDLPEIDDRNLRRDAGAVADEFAALLADAVRIRMRSDVPYGAFLSGGLDSGSVVALMAEVSPHPVKTFTIGFAQPAYDERPLARLVAERFATEHREEVVSPDVFEDALARVARHYDEPFGDASAIAVDHVSRQARREVKMVLTGDGGDEVLSGYTIYQGEKFARRYGTLPAPLRAGLPLLLDAAAGLTRGRVRRGLRRAHDVCRTSNLSFLRRLIEKVSWADTDLIRAVLAEPRDVVPIEDAAAELMDGCSYRDPFYRLMYYNLKHSLPDKMLVKVDRMSMASSLEVRAPFLDHRLVELMVGVDKDVKMRGYERKSVLRRSVARRLPPALLRAPKKGFAVPVGDWFRGAGFARYAAGLAASGGCGLAVRPLRDILERNERGETAYGNLLWILILLDRFCRESAPRSGSEVDHQSHPARVEG